jgi:hypothetical protein
MRINLKIIFVVFIILLCIFIFYIYCPYHAYNYKLNELKDYFAVVNTFTTLIIGIIGLIIGLFYYYDKESRRPRVKYLLDNLNSYDNLLTDFFNMSFNNQKELDALRNKISRGFEMIELILNSSFLIMKFSDDDIRTILKINSYVDKSEVIMRTPFPSLEKVKFLDSQDTYVELIKSAKWVCIKHSG